LPLLPLLMPLMPLLMLAIISLPLLMLSLILRHFHYCHWYWLFSPLFRLIRHFILMLFHYFVLFIIDFHYW
jgi:hypothetical protein